MQFASGIPRASIPSLLLFADTMDSSEIPNHCGHGLRSERFVTPLRQISNGVGICPPLPRRSRVNRNRILIGPFAPLDFDGAPLEVPSVHLTDADRIDRIGEWLVSSRRFTPSANSSFTRVGFSPPARECFDENQLCTSIRELQVSSSDEMPYRPLEESQTLFGDCYSDVNGAEQ